MTAREKTIKILRILGLLGVAPTLVLNFCALFVEDQLLTIGLVIITTTIVVTLYVSQHINRHLSALPLVILFEIALTINFIYLYKTRSLELNPSCQPAGILNYYENAEDFYADIGPSIEKCNHSVWFYGISFDESMKKWTPLIEKNISQDVDFHFRIPNPKDSILIAEIARRCGATYKDIEDEIMLTIEMLNDLEKKFQHPSSQHNLEIVFISHIPNYRAYFFDPYDSNHYSYIVPYPSIPVDTLPGYQVKNTPNGMMRQFFNDIQSTDYIAQQSTSQHWRNSIYTSDGKEPIHKTDKVTLK